MALTDKLTAIGDAIREKNGSSELIPLADMPQAILDIVGGDGSGGGVTYTDIVYNEDNTITLTDTDGKEHIMECVYSEDGKLASVKYDGKAVELTYDGDVLVAIGNTAVDMANVPTEIGQLETIIDQSGVLEESEDTVTEKVEELIDKAELENAMYQISESWTQAPFTMGTEVELFPRLNLKNCKTVTFNGMKNVKRIDYYLNTEKGNNFNECFGGFSSLEYMKGVDTSKATVVLNMFKLCENLKIIEEPLNFSSMTGSINAFYACTSLEDVRFVENCIKASIGFYYSSLLSAESIQSIINGLATVQTAQTLTLHKDIVLTDEQKATINAKGWTLAQ